MTRLVNDDYPTPGRLALAICRRVQADCAAAPETILEPSCGAGNFLRASARVWPGAASLGLEVSEPHAARARQHGFAVRTCDALAEDRAGLGRFDLVIGNPPYSEAERFCRRFRQCLTPNGWLVYLLRLNFLGGQRRYAQLWTRWRPSRMYVLPRRPAFMTGSGTDSTEYAVFCWQRALDPNQPVVTEWLDNREIGNKRGPRVRAPQALEP